MKLCFTRVLFVAAFVAAGASPVKAQAKQEKTSAKTPYVLTEGMNVPGNDLGVSELKTFSVMECQQLCAADGKCTGFVVTKAGAFNFAQPRCWLKSGDMQLALKERGKKDACCTLGVKR